MTKLLALLVLATACATHAQAPRVVNAPPAPSDSDVAKQKLSALGRALVTGPPLTGAQALPPKLLEGNRIAGIKYVIPDDDTKVAIMMTNQDKVIGSFKVCINSAGELTVVQRLQTTGFPAYDEKILREMSAGRYSPYRVNGRAVPVCTAVTFIYRQQPYSSTARAQR